jgi:signal transduction histidine kinase
MTRLKIGVFALLVVFFVGLSGYAYFINQHDQLNLLARDNLSAIANLKATQIESWLSERRSDAEIIYDNYVFVDPLLAWLGDKRSPVLKKEIETWMASLCSDTSYSSILLLDPQGKITIDYIKNGETSLQHEQLEIAEAARTSQIIMGDLHRDVEGNISLDIFVPVRNHKKLTVGLLVMRVNPALFLYPMIQTWPVPSRSAETLLVRRDGEEIVFLNELRHQKNTALKLRFPLNSRNLPAALVARGFTGLIEGRDYRGVPVLAIGRSVPRTNWHIVAKVDASEVYLPMVWVGLRAVAFGTLIFCLFGAGLYFLINRQSKAVLTLQNYYLQRSQELALVGSWDLDLKKNILIWTDETYRIFNIPVGTPLTYEKFVSFVHPDDQERVDKAWQTALTTKSYDIEHRILVDGQVKWVREKARLQVDKQGQVSRGIGAVMDITEYKRLVNIRDEFVNTVSHELRTPMAIIHEGVAQVLEGIHGPVNEEQTRFLSTTLRSIDRLGRIINNLLDISRLESGKMVAKKEMIDLAQLARETAASFRPQAEKKGLALKEQLPAGPVNLCADRDEITEVLTNLIGNALKFTSQGEIGIAVSDRDAVVECSVTDTGRGIAADNLPKVFEKFTQFGRVAGPGEKGTGLGLAIVKALLDLHDGQIRVESRENAGSKFTFTLPKNIC